MNTNNRLSSFNRNSTADEVLEGIDLSGRTAIVTGAGSGIGIETARSLAKAGAKVTLAVRNLEQGQRAADDINASTDSDRARVAPLHLDSVHSVDEFVGNWSGTLDILINNAGVMTTPETYTEAGWELQFATNHLGHFALATGLHSALARSGSARVVSVSSSGHGNSPILFDDLFFDKRPYDAGTAYGQSKTANVLFAVEAQRRWGTDGITANACMPGGVWTQLQRHWDAGFLANQKAAAAGIVKTPQQGAATSVLLATAPELEGQGGKYFDDCQEAPIVPQIINGLHGVRDWALDPEAAQELWNVSTELLHAERQR